MMPNNKNQQVIFVFSELPADRDYLRGCLSENGEAIVCFEKETICFDNLETIQPSGIVAKTDSDEIAWRFIFALNALRVNCTLTVVSDVIKTNKFKSVDFDVPVQCLTNREFNNGILEKIKGFVYDGNNDKRAAVPPIVGQNDRISNIRHMLPCLAHSNTPILITGEKGTGKELLARRMALLAGMQRAFVKINCQNLNPEMIAQYTAIEKALATKDDQSVMVLLEDVHLLKEKAQAELLLLLDQPDKWMVGAGADRNASIRFIATAEKNLENLVSLNLFRKDLYYRLNVIPISMPSLRNRPGDISMLMDYFIIQACAQQQKSVFTLSEQLKTSLRKYKWPGNVSELKKTMLHIASSGDESVVYLNKDIPKSSGNSFDQIFSRIDEQALPNIFEIQKYLSAMKTLSLKKICDEFVSRTEKRLMQKALESTNWNRKKAAELLNISYKSMLNKMKMYEIS